jgi:endonuclease/exonuclease/phosphatase family metal-dependent hydrolase
LPANVLILGDFNIHWDTEHDIERQQLSDLLVSSGSTQHVNFVTHTGGHTLDYVITRDADNRIKSIGAGDTIADHATVLATLHDYPPSMSPSSLPLIKIVW